MSLLGRLFGSGEAIKKTSQGLYDGIDAAFFTEEEKSAHFLTLLKAYEPFKLAQRLIAFSITSVFLFNVMASGILLMIALSMDWPSVVMAAKTLAEMNKKTLELPFSLVVGFYFGGGALQGILRSRDVKK